MDHAPLRPLPARPSRPPDPDTAARWLEAALPELDRPAARALAAVALAGRSRAEAAALASLTDDELPRALARARKALRRSAQPLPGSGWCERAEGLISDRLDGAVREPDVRRLDVHLRNCPRCVEHERRLVQATDALLAGIAPARPSPAPPALPPAPLAPVGDEDEAPREGASGGVAPPAPDAPSPVAPAADAPAPAQPAASGSPTSEQIEAAAEVLVTARTRSQLATAVTWNAMIAIAVLLTLAAIALTLAGILGAEL